MYQTFVMWRFEIVPLSFIMDLPESLHIEMEDAFQSSLQEVLIASIPSHQYSLVDAPAFDRIPRLSFRHIHVFNDSVKALILSRGSFNDMNTKVLSLCNRHSLTFLSICNCCFAKVHQLIIADCPHLQSIWIGNDCFYSQMDSDTRLSIQHCSVLKNIVIRNRTFRYLNDCILEGLFNRLSFTKISLSSLLFILVLDLLKM